MTNIQDGHAPDAVYEEVREQFTDVETVNLDAGDCDDQCVEPDLDCAGGAFCAWERGEGLIDPNEGDVRFENEGSLEPLPVVRERTVVMRAVGLTKIYAAVSDKAGSGGAALELFRGLDLKVHAGEMVAIVGESGAGKSSLLHLLAALDMPTAGEVWCGESRLSGFTPKQAADYRNRDVGYVWQFHYLLPEFSAAENVAMPLLARGMGRAAALEKAAYWLGRGGAGGQDGKPVRGVERRRAAKGESGEGAGDGAEDSTGR